MSDSPPPSATLVVDADIGRSASERVSSDPTGRMCVDFLDAIVAHGHRAAFSPALATEWEKHAGRYAQAWEIKMTRQGLRLFLDDVPTETVDAAIRTAAENKGVEDLLLKDSHLVALAVLTGQRIASREAKSRRHFSVCLTSVPEVMDLVWVNPARAEEAPCEWLAAGAPDEHHRKLRNFSAA